jgi:hypothetical protein
MTRAMLPGRQTSKTDGRNLSQTSIRYKRQLEDKEMFRELQWELGAIWCGLMHESLMWPVHGHYECRTCGRRYPAFAEAVIAGRAEETAWESQLPASAPGVKAGFNRA